MLVDHVDRQQVDNAPSSHLTCMALPTATNRMTGMTRRRLPRTCWGCSPSSASSSSTSSATISAGHRRSRWGCIHTTAPRPRRYLRRRHCRGHRRLGSATRSAAIMAYWQCQGPRGILNEASGLCPERSVMGDDRGDRPLPSVSRHVTRGHVLSSTDIVMHGREGP